MSQKLKMAQNNKGTRIDQNISSNLFGFTSKKHLSGRIL